MPSPPIRHKVSINCKARRPSSGLPSPRTARKPILSKTQISKAPRLVSPRNGSQAENPPLHGSQATIPAKRSPPSPDPHVVTLILSIILNIPISTHQASHTKAYRKNSRYTQGVLAYTQKKKGGRTRYPGVHSAFADLPAQDLRLHPPNATPLSNPKLFPCPSLSRFPPLSRSWLFLVPSLARFLALLDPLSVGRGAAYGGRAAREKADGGWWEGGCRGCAAYVGRRDEEGKEGGFWRLVVEHGDRRCSLWDDRRIWSLGLQVASDQYDARRPRCLCE
jgi:hypothetical protein